MHTTGQLPRLDNNLGPLSEIPSVKVSCWLPVPYRQSSWPYRQSRRRVVQLHAVVLPNP